MVMPKVTATLEGAEELERALRELPTAALRKATIQRAFRKAGMPIVQAANIARPSGAIRSGLEVSIRPNLSKRQRRSQAPSTTSVEMFLGLGPSRLAHLFEFGTDARFTKGKGKKRKVKGAYRGRMTAHPYLRPAWDGGARKMLDDFGKILWKDIEATAKRYARRQAKKARQ